MKPVVVLADGSIRGNPPAGCEVEFVKLSPTQNMTVLVTTEHAADEYAGIASALMSYDHLHAEQVGFVRAPGSAGTDTRLEMAAGEFCGNACMALAAFDAFGRGLAVGESAVVVLEASGAVGPLPCAVLRQHDRYSCRLAMPIPTTVVRGRLAEVTGDHALVRYDDALHVVVESERIDAATRDGAQALARRLGREPSLSLIGVLVYGPSSSRLTPLIHVPELDSMVWERGCGSGTASLGAYLAWKSRETTATTVNLPGGPMRVAARYEQGAVTGIRVTGSVRMVAQGRAFLH